MVTFYCIFSFFLSSLLSGKQKTTKRLFCSVYFFLLLGLPSPGLTATALSCHMVLSTQPPSKIQPDSVDPSSVAIILTPGVHSLISRIDCFVYHAGFRWQNECCRWFFEIRLSITLLFYCWIPFFADSVCLFFLPFSPHFKHVRFPRC